MKRSRAGALAAPALLGVLALAGCGGRGADKGAAAESAAVDTTNAGALDGLSTQQIEAQAQPMSQEEAMRRGIIDTTIHVESLSSDDSILARVNGLPPEPAADTAPPPATP
ncbi:MAG TPA: hypothetical protein VF263_04785 [Longimicrobiaceae bacterium]